jgi:hypothetical protein
MNEAEEKASGNEPLSDATNDKGPTEQLRDEAKSDAGRLVPEESGVPGAQKQGNEEIKDEQGPNTE